MILRQPLISLTQHVAERVYTADEPSPKEEKQQKWESVMTRPVTVWIYIFLWLNEVWMLRLLLEQLLQSTIYVPSCVKLFTQVKLAPQTKEYKIEDCPSSPLPMPRLEDKENRAFL